MSANEIAAAHRARKPFGLTVRIQKVLGAKASAGEIQLSSGELQTHIRIQERVGRIHQGQQFDQARRHNVRQ